MNTLIIPPRNKIEEAMRNLPKLSRPSYSEPSRPPAPPVLPSDKKSRRTWRYFFFCLLIIILVPSFAYGSFLIYNHLRSATPTSSPASNASLISDVGKDIQLPAGETPTIATITDLAPLAGQEFFKDAAVGDKVLIFSSSSEAVLYRPSTKKVIVVAPLSTK